MRVQKSKMKVPVINISAPMLSNPPKAGLKRAKPEANADVPGVN